MTMENYDNGTDPVYAMELYQTKIMEAERHVRWNVYEYKRYGQFCQTPGVRVKRSQFLRAANGWRKRSVEYARVWAIYARKKRAMA